jgi:hypothetical protein
MTVRSISPRVAVSVVYVVAMFVAIMDTTIVNVALPTISRDLSVPLNRVDGVVRLPGQPGSFHPRLGLAGRPVRDQAGVPGRAGPVHGRLGAMRLGTQLR